MLVGSKNGCWYPRLRSSCPTCACDAGAVDTVSGYDVNHNDLPVNLFYPGQLIKLNT